MKFNEHGFAFPQHGWSTDPEVAARMADKGGMTLLEYYAGQALPQCIDMMRAAARKSNGVGFDFESAPARVACSAFDVAEAMVAESQKRKGGAA